jgi:ribosome-binding protein aMBF1 (putative translation factor)
MDDQDWTVVTVKRSKRTVGGGSHPHTYNGSQIGPKVIAARISGTAQALSVASNALEVTEIGKQKTLTAESRQEIIQKRVALGKNQVQLNQDCRFPVNTIREFEAGRLCPTVQQLNMLNRVLRASLKYTAS